MWPMNHHEQEGFMCKQIDAAGVETFNCPRKGPAISEPSCNAIMRVAEVQDFQLQNAKVEQARAPRGICLVRNHRISTFKRKQKHLTCEIEITQTISYKKLKTNK